MVFVVEYDLKGIITGILSYMQQRHTSGINTSTNQSRIRTTRQTRKTGRDDGSPVSKLDH